MRILIVDDHQLFIDGVRHILEKLDDDVEIIEANSADDAVRYIDQNGNLDLVLLDLNMPGMDGIAIITRTKARDVPLPIVVISSEDDIHKIEFALNAGAMGFIPKSSSSSELYQALLMIKQGEIYIPNALQERMSERRPRKQAQNEEDSNGYASLLTKRQQEILELMDRGYSNKQLSTALYISENTIKVHVSAIFKALGVNSRTQCIQIARQKGLID